MDIFDPDYFLSPVLRISFFERVPERCDPHVYRYDHQTLIYIK